MPSKPYASASVLASSAFFPGRGQILFFRMESRFAAKASPAPVSQLGFTVKEAVPQHRAASPKLVREAEVVADGSETEAWALPSHWKDSSDLHFPPNVSVSLSQAPASAFKGFKDCCEAGSFSLSGIQVLQENGRLEVVGTAHTSPGVRSLVKSVVGGLRACQQPEPSAEGLGGTYFFLDEAGRRKAIVKPCDEEPLAPNNPKGFVGRALGEPGLKSTVRVGEAALREVAAFLLDYQNFAHVPYTVLVRVTHNVFHVASQQPPAEDSSPASAAMSCSQMSASSIFNPEAHMALPPIPSRPPSKLASLQEFVQHSGDASEIGCSRFSTRDVHRIGILDLRLFNTDRHAGNMLVQRSRPSNSSWLSDKLDLIPIDHGFCLPEALEAPYLEWLHWPQATIPFDEEELAYISRLDAAADANFLRQELPWLPEGSLRTLQVATMLLTKCAAAGLTLAEIGQVASRPLVGLDEEASQLETLCLAARDAVDALEDIQESFSEGSETDAEEEAEQSPMAAESPPAAARHTSLVMGLKVPLQSAVSGDELLFDLEEEPTAKPLRHDPPLAPSLRASASPARGRASRAPALQSPESDRFATASQPGIAKSLATGMLHHRAARPNNNRRLRRQTRSLKATPKRRPHAAYPPHVVGMHQSGMNHVFDGLDERGWEGFIEILGNMMQDALDLGTWKMQPSTAGKGRAALGTSCRF